MPILSTGLLIAGAALSAAPIVANAFKSPAEKQAAELAKQQGERSQQLRNQLDRQGRPEMNAAVDRLNQLLSTNLGITDQERINAERGIDRSLSQGMSGVSSLGGGLRGLGAMTQGAGDAYGGMAAQNAQMQQANRLNLGQQLVGAEAQQEQFNELLPYLELRDEMQALEGASYENQYLAALAKTDRRNAMFQGIGGIGSSMMGLGGQFTNPSTVGTTKTINTGRVNPTAATISPQGFTQPLTTQQSVGNLPQNPMFNYGTNYGFNTPPIYNPNN